MRALIGATLALLLAISPTAADDYGERLCNRHRGAEVLPPRPLPHHPACGSAPGGSMG